MNKLLKHLGLPALALAALALGSCSPKYEYETVPNDPLEARLYTLDNGLKVYMSVNKDEPRIQTYIAVRVGGKNGTSAPRTTKPRSPCWTRLNSNSRSIARPPTRPSAKLSTT